MFQFFCIFIYSDLDTICYALKSTNKCPVGSLLVNSNNFVNWSRLITNYPETLYFYFVDNAYDSKGVPLVLDFIDIPEDISQVVFQSDGKNIFIESSISIENPSIIRFENINVQLSTNNPKFSQLEIFDSKIFSKIPNNFILYANIIKINVNSLKYLLNSIDTPNLEIDLSQPDLLELNLLRKEITHITFNNIINNSILHFFKNQIILTFPSTYFIFTINLLNLDGTITINFNPNNEINFDVINLAASIKSLYPNLRIYSNPLVNINIPISNGDYLNQPTIIFSNELKYTQTSSNSNFNIYNYDLLKKSTYYIGGASTNIPPVSMLSNYNDSKILANPNKFYSTINTQINLQNGEFDSNYLSAFGSELTIKTNKLNFQNSKINVLNGTSLWIPKDLFVSRTNVYFGNVDFNGLTINMELIDDIQPKIIIDNLINCGNNINLVIDSNKFNSQKFDSLSNKFIDLICSQPVRHCSWNYQLNGLNKNKKFIYDNYEINPLSKMINNQKCYGIQISKISNLIFNNFFFSKNLNSCPLNSKLISNQEELYNILQYFPLSESKIQFNIFDDISNNGNLLLDLSLLTIPIDLEIISKSNLFTLQITELSINSNKIRNIKSNNINLDIFGETLHSVQLNSIILNDCSISTNFLNKLNGGNLEIPYNYLLNNSIINLPSTIIFDLIELNIQYLENNLILINNEKIIYLSINSIFKFINSIEIQLSSLSLNSIITPITFIASRNPLSIYLTIEEGFPTSFLRNQFVTSLFKEVDISINEPWSSYKHIFSEDNSIPTNIILRTSISSLNLCKEMWIPTKSTLTIIPSKPILIDALLFKSNSYLKTINNNTITIENYHIEGNNHEIPNFIEPITLHIGMFSNIIINGKKEKLENLYALYNLQQMPFIYFKDSIPKNLYLEFGFISQNGPSLLRTYEDYFIDEIFDFICSPIIDDSILPHLESKDPDFSGNSSIFLPLIIKKNNFKCISMQLNKTQPKPDPTIPPIPDPTPTTHHQRGDVGIVIALVGGTALLIAIITGSVIYSNRNLEENPPFSTVPLITQENDEK